MPRDNRIPQLRERLSGSASFSCGRMLDSEIEKKVVKFRSFEEAEKADRDFYDKLAPRARLEILLELLNHGPEQRLERTYRITKFAPR
jgi:hypothetical protein